jgi:hypothetical protein
MRDLSCAEADEVAGSGNILKIGFALLGYTAAFIVGGPAGLGVALSLTVAEQGIEKLDTLVEYDRMT